jgi:TonB family protein
VVIGVMIRSTNIIRLDEFIGPPARQSGDVAPLREPTQPGISSATSRNRDEPVLGNVIAFVQPVRGAVGEDQSASLVLGSVEPLASESDPAQWRSWIFGLLILSAAVHASAIALLNRPPPPMASIGVEAMSVEIVLGDDTPAAPPSPPPDAPAATPPPADSITKPSTTWPPELKTDAAAPAEPASPPSVALPSEAQPDPAVAATPPPQELSREPERPVEAAKPPEQKPVEPQAPTATPSEAQPAPVVAAIPPPQESPREPERPVEAAKPPQQKPVQPPPKPAEAKPKREHAKPREHPKPAAPAGPNTRHAAVAAAPSGAGPGRSDAETNYRGIAAAHLARFKQFPPEARSRGAQGNSVVSFTIDGSGRVTRVSLVRGTGIASLDQESQAMVRRASPFPPPPGGRPVSITAPVSFHLR